MLQYFDIHASLFSSWSIERYEQEGNAHFLIMKAILKDNSRIEIRDYVFLNGNRKYSYHWMEENGQLRFRWDNAPHWIEIETAPHHIHCGENNTPESSLVNNIEDLLNWIELWFDRKHE